ncbi:MAG: glycosyltransferase family 2 protein [Methanoregula sp.]|nr:glycosyltransferase family 2 protein [Methanoregula sp.]
MPAYNEEIAIGSVVIRTRQFVNTVIVIDDGSLDMTSIIAEHADAEVIRLSKNHGKAYAVLRGFDRARQLNADIVIMLDGDGQHHPEEIPSIIAPILKDDADLVIGSRFLKNENSIPFYRKVGQKTLDTFTKFASSYKSTDSQSGFRALNAKALNCFTIEPSGYDIESVMISYLSDKGFRIVEVPIDVNYEVPHKHKKNFFSHGMAVLSNLVGIIGYRRPLISFGMPGLILMLFGFYMGIWAITDYTANKVFPYSLTAVAGVFLVIGLMFLNTALILNSLVQLMQHSPKK